MRGVTAIPGFTIRSPAHTLGVQVTLRALLVELGASVPANDFSFQTAKFDARSGPFELIGGSASSRKFS